ncbi:hypothetical protein [Sphingomonas sp.]|uniref:hypothetical protein n=1 Tax=Sphingomonas sp. TaxID=28214 RepID=UPI00286C1E3C|nr:hypothetical protein [Sphingomonas sp.]
MSIDPPPANGASRARRIAASGWFIILLSAATAVLPLVGPGHAAAIIGASMVLAGLSEIIAATARHETRRLVMLAGAISVVGGLLFATDPATGFLPALIIVMGWLFLRGLVLGAACVLERGSVRKWTGLAAATDIVLALALVIGLSISTLVVTLFGATPPLIASFAWVLAISFVASGTLLLVVARCARAEDV